MEDIEYIKKFNKIKTKTICDRIGVDYRNLLKEKTTKENEKKVKEEIENQIAKLYIKGEENGK